MVSDMETIINRLGKAIVAAFVAFTVGTVGFWLLAPPGTSWFDAFCMTVITLSTVGYGEVIPLDTTGKLFASLLIITGMSTVLYLGSTIVALWVETDVIQLRRRKKMQKQIDAMNGHYIVCGCGTTGGKVVDELYHSGASVVVVDTDTERLDTMSSRVSGDILFLPGDATDDEVLHNAGVERAAGLIAALRNDKDNIYLILSAKYSNPRLRVVARATEKDAPAKMKKAGADTVVSPNMIGGMRIASEMVRPHVTEFLDVMLRDKNAANRIEQVVIEPGAALAGTNLLDPQIRKSVDNDVLVIAIKTDNEHFIYNPAPETVLRENYALIVLGEVNAIRKMRERIMG
jgi:voltage-gated potassium channel